MAFKKGREKTGGAKTGSKHIKTRQWEALGLMHEEGGAETAKKILKALGEKAFKEDGSINVDMAIKYMNIYNTTLEYFKPKQARVENVNKGETVIVVKHE